MNTLQISIPVWAVALGIVMMIIFVMLCLDYSFYKRMRTWAMLASEQGLLHVPLSTLNLVGEMKGQQQELWIVKGAGVFSWVATSSESIQHWTGLTFKDCRWKPFCWKKSAGKGRILNPLLGFLSFEGATRNRCAILSDDLLLQATPAVPWR